MQLLWKPSRRRYLSTPAASMGTFMVQLASQTITYLSVPTACAMAYCAHASSLGSVGTPRPCMLLRCWRRAALMRMCAAMYPEDSQAGTHS